MLMKRIACIGSITTDIIVKPVNQVPTPGELWAVDSISTHVGGCASNAAIDLAKLGVPSELVCAVGSDQFGSFVRSTCEQNGVGTAWDSHLPGCYDHHIYGLCKFRRREKLSLLSGQHIGIYFGTYQHGCD